ncbi:MAG: acetate/propionate family kinase [Spirochaetes bacterium]|nr:acetate/propionate family kinase [Spirochaetota bacterium]
MNVLILNPRKNYIELFYYKNNSLIVRDMIFAGLKDKIYKDYYFNILNNYFMKSELSPDYLIIKSLYGGDIFNKPVLYNNLVLKQLNKIVNKSPLQINLLIEIINGCRRLFDTVPIVLFFETSFFHKLPVYEKMYAIDPDISNNNGFFRFGYHGIHHEAALNFIYDSEIISKFNNRILSVYLDKNPEIVAIKNKKPVTVTSGATPLEGIMGEKKCGKLDPSIVFILIKKLKIGLEKINYLLTQQSGLYGLTGKKISFLDLYNLNVCEFEQAKTIFEYNIQLEIGSGISAIGGLDYIIFSGNYSEIGKYLLKDLNGYLNHINNNLKIYFFNDSIGDAVLKLFNYHFFKKKIMI